MATEAELQQHLDSVLELGVKFEEERSKLAQRYDGLTNEVVEKLSDKLAKGFVGLQDFQLQQRAAEKAQAEVLELMDKRFNELARLTGGSRDEAKEREARHRDMLREFIWAGGVPAPDSRAGKYGASDEYRDYCRAIEGQSPRAEKRALSESVGFDGGYLVPEDIVSEIIKPAVNLSPVRELARVVQTTSNSYVTHDLTAYGSATWANEITDGTESNPTYGEIRIPIHDLKRKILATEDWLQDAPNPEAEMAEVAAVSFEVAEGAAFVSGSGVGRPTGFVTRHAAAAAGSNYILTGGNAAADLVAADDFYDLLYGTSESTGLQQKYRRNAIFGFNSNTLRKVLKLQDGGGNYLWNSFAGLQRGEPATIAGRPFRILEDMQDDGTNGNYPVVVADWQSYYRVVDRSGIRVLRDPYSSHPKYVFRWVKRLGADVTLLEAGRLLIV